MKIEVKWKVVDGYIGKNRPQTTTFETNDYYDGDDWNMLSENEKKALINEIVQQDFDNKISYEINDFGL